MVGPWWWYGGGMVVRRCCPYPPPPPWPPQAASASHLADNTPKCVAIPACAITCQSPPGLPQFSVRASRFKIRCWLFDVGCFPSARPSLPCRAGRALTSLGLGLLGSLCRAPANRSVQALGHFGTLRAILDLRCNVAHFSVDMFSS